jgi:hypothetical protein
MINRPFAAVTFIEVQQVLWLLFLTLQYIYKSHIHGTKEVGSTAVFRCLAVVMPMYIADFNCPVF